MLLIVLEFACVTGVGILGGAMIYESLVEISVRQHMSASQQLANWKLVFPRASGLFKPFGIALLPAIIACGWLTGQYMWFLAGFILFLLVPFTAIAIAGTNVQIIDIDDNASDEVITSAIKGWDKLHHVRSIMTVSAFVICAAAVTLT